METLMHVAIVWAFWWAIFKVKAYCYRMKVSGTEGNGNV